MKTKLMIVGYILMGALTYGYAYNDHLKIQTEIFPGWKGSNIAESQLMGLFCGAVWPLYWPCHVSVKMWSNIRS